MAYEGAWVDDETFLNCKRTQLIHISNQLIAGNLTDDEFNRVRGELLSELRDRNLLNRPLTFNESTDVSRGTGITIEDVLTGRVPIDIMDDANIES